MTDIKKDIVSATDVGLVREQNEDSCGVSQTPNGALCVVCDGMGGHSGGETASIICISMLEAAVLAKNGLLDEGDLIGEQGFCGRYGGFSIGARINLRKVQIGDREIHNVEATIIENPSASCLLGQTALSHFGKYTIDNQNNEIIFE